MKFNVYNFIEQNKTNSDLVYYIKDEEKLVRFAHNDWYSFIGCLYHNVKWWSYHILNGKLVLLMYIENPKIKYDAKEYFERLKYFNEIQKVFEEGN